MEQNLNNKLKDRLYKYFPSKKPGASSGPTLISNTINIKNHSNDVLIPRIRVQPMTRKIPPLQRQPSTFKQKSKMMSQSQYAKKKQVLKQIQINQLSNDAKAILNLRKTLAGQGLLKDQKYVTPVVVFDFFRNFPYMCQDFFYLNKGLHPYDYHVVEFKQKNPNEYMTISCKGVTQFIYKQACFMSQQEWVKQEKMYHSLQKIDFFKKYKVNKNFRIWRNMMKRHHLEQISNVLNEKLFLTINPSRKAILAIKNQCINFEQGCRMFIPDMRDVYQIQDFDKQIREFQKNMFLQNIKRHQQKVVEILDCFIKEWIDEYKKQNNIESKDGKTYNYSRKALLRMQYIKIHHLIKLIQNILKDSKLNMVINNIDFLLDHLQNIGDQQRQESIICRVNWENNKFIWQPSTDKFKNIFMDLIVHAIRILSDNSSNLEQLPIFVEYTVDEQNSNDFKKEEKHDLFSICTEDQKYKEITKCIIMELEKTFDNFQNEEKKLIDYVEIYQRHGSINKLKQQIYEMTTAELRRIIKEYKVEKIKMQSMDDKLERGLIFLNYSKLRDKIVNAPSESLTLILNQLPVLMLSKIKQLENKIDQHSNELSQYPNNVEKFVKCMQSVNKASSILQTFNTQSQQLIQLYGLMQEQKIPYLDRYKLKSKQTFQNVQKLKNKIDDFYANYDQNLNKWKKDLELSALKVDSLVDQLISKFQNVPINKKDSSIDQIIEFIEVNRRLAEQVNNQATETNRLQTSLGLPLSGFAKVQAFYSMFDMMSKLWLGRKKWYEILIKVKNQHFQKVNLEELEQQFNKTIELTVQLIDSLADQSEVAKIFQEEVKNFESVIKTLKALRDPNIREEQQWIEISQFIYKKSHPQAQLEDYQVSELPLAQRKDPMYTVNWLTHYGIHQWHEELSYFGIKAAKQKELMEVLNECKKFLFESQITFTQFNQSKDVYRLSEQNQTLFSQIDEKIIILHNIMANKYSKNLYSKIDLLLKQYQYLQQLFEEMLIHQQNWQLLEPVLSLTSSKVLNKQLKDFSTCDSHWKRVTKNLRQNSQCHKISNDYINKHQLKAVIKSNSILESIQKSLDDFLQKKRSILPRLHFISNQQMLTLMSQAHSLKQVSPFLHKLFTAVKQLQFEKDTPTGIISFDQQVIGFKQFGIRPQGEIEQMMKVIDQQIKRSLGSIFKNLLPKYDDEEISLENLIIEYPSQVANIIEWITWTKIGQNYLGPEPFGELYNWLAIQQQQIQTLIQLLKRKDLKSRHKAIRSLFVQSLYLKQSTYSMMMKEVTSVNDFNWQKIIKFYSNPLSPEIYMNQFNSKLGYGFEFQLIGSPFIITPTCQRQILNLNQVIYENSLPILMGKSCTGKSETLKGVSQLLGHNLVMCTCDNDSSIKVIERLINAACATGSWIAFQHFDALPLTTISIAASMISAIYQGLLSNKDSIILNKSSINLSPTTSIFLSVASNNEFKTQIFKEYQRIISFRPIEQQQLYRIILDSYIFKQSNKLAKLLCQTIEYVNKQIVDYQYQLNVRDSKQIVMHLIDLDKDQFKSEQQMLVYILNKMISPRVYTNSQKFKDFLNSLIPVSEQNIQVANKQQIFFDLLDIKSAVIVYGESLTGKTTFISSMNKKLNQDKEIHYITVNSLEIWEIVGSHDNRIQGLLVNIPKESWIIFDGDLNLIEPIYSQMQRDYISLEKGETIVNKNWKVIFETSNLSSLPPTLIGKVGLLNMNDILTFEQIISKQITKINNPQIPNWLVKNLEIQLNTSFKKIISSKKSYALIYPTNDNSLLLNCCYNLITICNSFNYKLKQKDTKQIKKVVEKIIAWCLIWGIGKLVTEQSLARFQKLFQDIIKLENQPSLSMFQYYLSSNHCQWLEWEELYSNNYTLIQSINSIFIPNAVSNCFRYFISNYIKDQKHFMILGEGGVGRSTVLKNCLRQIKDELNLYSLSMIIPQHQNSKYLQELIQNEMQLQKQDNKHFLVPLAGKKFIIEIDEMNLGATNSSSQLLRELISHKGMYDRKTFKWKSISNVTIASMGRIKSSSQENQNECNTRLSNLLSIFVKRDNRDNMTSIFSKMIELWFNDSEIKSNIYSILDPMTIAKTTLDIMDQVKFIQHEEKNPCMVSYKDINLLFSMMMEIKIKKQMKPEEIVKLWAYELMRTFGDRLFEKTNKQKLSEIIIKKSFINLKCSLNQNLLEPDTFYTSRITSLQYEESTLQAIENQIEKKLESNQKTRILMFRQIIDHVTRMSRGIDIDGGHFMMIGNRGVGKMSIAKFACYLFKMNMLNSECFKDEESFVNCLIRAAQGIHTCILINQRDLKDEKILFFVKNIVCKTIQSIDLTKQQLEMITNENYTEMNLKIQESIKDFFQKSHNFIHLIFCLPRNQQTNQFLRDQPLFSRNCTIDFIQEWPESTFMQLTEMNLYTSFESEEKQKLSKLNYRFYNATIQMTQGTEIIISPKQYLENISLFNTKYAVLKQEIEFSSTKIHRCLKYVNDIKNIIEMEESNIKYLEQEISNINKKKQQISHKMERKQKELQSISNFDSQDVQYVSIKKQFASINEKKTKLIINFRKSIQLLNSISSKDILLLKITGENPSSYGVLKLSALLLKQNQSWEQLQKTFLSNTSLLSRLKIFDIGDVNIDVLTSLADHMNSISTITDNLTNTTLNILIKWFVNFMDIVNQYLNLVGQQKDLLKDEIHDEPDYMTIQQELFNLQSIIDNNSYYMDLIDYDIKKSQRKIKICQTILTTVDQQIQKWKLLLLKNDQRLKMLTNNLFFACNTFKYLTLFNSEKRQILLNKWKQILKEEDITYSQNYIEILFDQYEIELVKNYTKQNFLNCIVMLKSPGVPYLIDPNRLFYTFLKQHYQNLKIVNSNEQGSNKIIEQSIEKGMSILLEYFEQNLSSLLSKIVNKSSEQNKTIMINDTEVQFSSNFKLFILNPNSAPKVSQQVYINCPVIHFDMKRDHIYQRLCLEFQNTIFSEQKYKHSQAISDCIANKARLEKKEDLLMSMIQSLNIDTHDIMEIIQEYTNIQLQKKQTEEQILRLQKEISELSFILNKHNKIIEEASYLAEIVLDEYKSMFTFKKFREVFVKILSGFNESTFIQQLIEEVYMRILYSTKQQHQQQVILLFTLYTLSRNHNQFKVIWSIVKEKNESNQKDIVNKLIEKDILQKNIHEKLDNLSSRQNQSINQKENNSGLVEELALTPIQNTLVSYLLKSPIKYPPLLSEFEYVSRALQQIHPILLIESSGVNQLIRQLAKKFEIPDTSILSIYAGQLEKNQDEIQKYNWFLVQNCDNHPRIFELVDRFKMEQRRFFLVFKKEQKMPNNVYPITRIHLCLRQKNVLLDQQLINNILFKYCTSKQSAGIILKLIEIFNKRVSTNIDCPCARMSADDVERNIRWIIDASKASQFKLSQLVELILILAPCTSQEHLNYVTAELALLTEDSITYEAVAHKLPEEVLRKFTS